MVEAGVVERHGPGGGPDEPWRAGALPSSVAAAGPGVGSANVMSDDAARTFDHVAAFTRLVERRLPASYRLAAIVLGDRAEAEDATHEAILAAWSRAGTLRNPDAFEAWFDRILVNVCRDRLRHGRVLRMVSLDLAADVPAPDPMGPLGERDLVGRAFARLNPEQRIAVVLRFWADLSVEEIARRTGSRAGTVKSRLHYALAAMHDALDADGEGEP